MRTTKTKSLIVKRCLLAALLCAAATNTLATQSDQPVTSSNGNSTVPPSLDVTTTGERPADREASWDVTFKGTSPPKYPAKALAEGVTGVVVLRVVVGADGSIKQITVEASRPRGVFDAAAIEAAKTWHFNPAIKNGKPVEGWARVPVQFKL